MRPSKAERDKSFAAFMDQAGPALLRTAWVLTGDADRAQELTQATSVKTYVVWHKIDHDTALAYARRCLLNHKIDVWRATRHEVADLTGDALELASASAGSASQPHDGAIAPLIIATTSCAGCPGCRSNNARSSSCGTTPTSPRRPWPRRSASPSAR